MWWIAVGALLIGELLTGTFYLLMVACGCIAGGLVRVAGGSVELQWAIAALVAALAVYLLQRSRRGRAVRVNPEHNPDINLDIGATLDVAGWRDGAARAMYRGAEWDVELAPGESEHAGRFRIVAVRGSRLVVRDAT
ncbi:NfeD family protein [Pararobbsia silviterrae]|nr:NfeD family protein [Pararobbsia silviterrae]